MGPGYPQGMGMVPGAFPGAFAGAPMGGMGAPYGEAFDVFPCVKLRGLPFHVGEHDIRGFLVSLPAPARAAPRAGARALVSLDPAHPARALAACSPAWLPPSPVSCSASRRCQRPRARRAPARRAGRGGAGAAGAGRGSDGGLRGGARGRVGPRDGRYPDGAARRALLRGGVCAAGQPDAAGAGGAEEPAAHGQALRGGLPLPQARARPPASPGRAPRQRCERRTAAGCALAGRASVRTSAPAALLLPTTRATGSNFFPRAECFALCLVR